MKHRIWIGLMAALSALLMSCGGGGGGSDSGGAGGTGGDPVANGIQLYVGEFVATCEALGEDINLDQGGMVYGRMTSKVDGTSQSAASFSFRIDFYADAQCAVLPLGSFTNANPLNSVTIMGATRVGGVAVDRVQFSIHRSGDAFLPGGTPDVVVVGTAIRLALPATLAQGFIQNDLWRMDGNVLYEGDLTVGVDGFPTGLDRTLPVSRVASAPAPAPAACSATTLNWTGVDGQCSASLPLSLSGHVLGAEDRDGALHGDASFACSNGAWVERPPSVCVSTAPPPVPRCPAQAWTWMVNGEVCSGHSTPAVQDGLSGVWNEIAGRTGSKFVYCRLNESGVLAWSEFHPNGLKYESCALTPPIVPPPPATEPVEILRRANCLACHAISGGGSLLSFETIAAHYRGNPPAPGVLEQKIRQGGWGVFGPTPMPPNPQISDAQIDIVVPWILSR